MTSHVPLAAQVRRAQRNGIGDLLWRSAERFPDKTAIVYRNIRQSYAQLDEAVNRMANALTERGIRKGDRIALLSRNSHAFVVVFFAAARLGAILVPINFMLNAAEVAYILGHAQPSRWCSKRGSFQWRSPRCISPGSTCIPAA